MGKACSQALHLNMIGFTFIQPVFTVELPFSTIKKQCKYCKKCKNPGILPSQLALAFRVCRGDGTASPTCGRTGKSPGKGRPCSQWPCSAYARNEVDGYRETTRLFHGLHGWRKLVKIPCKIAETCLVAFIIHKIGNYENEFWCLSTLGLSYNL
jgi:hypothetical protein